MSAVRAVVTGAPGAGKTTVLDLLAARGWTVVPEAATEVNEQLAAAGATEAWRPPDFPDRIVALQLERERAAGDEGVQLLDRTVVCTLALARYLALPVPAALRDALRRVEGGPVRPEGDPGPAGRPLSSDGRPADLLRGLAAVRAGPRRHVPGPGLRPLRPARGPPLARADQVGALLDSWGLRPAPPRPG